MKWYIEKKKGTIRSRPTNSISRPTATEMQQDPKHILAKCTLTSVFETFIESLFAQVMEGNTGNSKNVPKKSTRLGRMIGFRQYTLRLPVPT